MLLALLLLAIVSSLAVLAVTSGMNQRVPRLPELPDLTNGRFLKIDMGSVVKTVKRHTVASNVVSFVGNTHIDYDELKAGIRSGKFRVVR